MTGTRIEIELRCKRRLHGVLNVSADILDLGEEARQPPTQPHNVYVKQCRQCSKDMGRPVVHRWDAVTGEMIEGDESSAA